MNAARALVDRLLEEEDYDLKGELMSTTNVDVAMTQLGFKQTERIYGADVYTRDVLGRDDLGPRIANVRVVDYRAYGYATVSCATRSQGKLSQKSTASLDVPDKDVLVFVRTLLIYLRRRMHGPNEALQAAQYEITRDRTA